MAGADYWILINIHITFSVPIND